ncbi:hypothetical protein LTR53_006106 [Teratosphaeriaceae sp. CCFEE 6253]|nr:hypothetical protein LTR53_006106 [Teratosphaeriaceae sp. CCFEE 6253]
MSSIKPMKTERTHEENQERAYIAASRRSDRSLEARVESARRASEIHKRRTGRSLRVSEQDVINEEMYEEEDDDLPMQYRRLTAHLQTQNADFNRRFQAFIVNQVAMRQGLGNAAADGMPMNPMGNQYQQPGQFINPGYMQMPQQPMHPNTMMPPQSFSRTPSSYRQQPYPMPQNNVQNVQANYHNHGRPLSIAMPQNAPQLHHQQSQSAQASPVDTKSFDDRRMSLPVHTTLPHTPVSQQSQVPSPTHAASRPISRTGSNGTASTPQSYYKQEHPSPQQTASPPDARHSQLQHPQPKHTAPRRQEMLPSPFTAGFDQQMNAGLAPLSMTLPLDAQQILADSSSLDPHMSMMFSPQTYSYNPNGSKPRSQHNTPPLRSYDGLSQTLTAPALDTGFTGFDPSAFVQSPPSAAYMDPAYTPQTPQFGFGGMGFDNGFGGDLFKSGFDVSGDVTPQEMDFSTMFSFPDPSSQEEQPLA